MIIELSDFLRYSIHKDVNQKTTLKKELENIDRYLAIEKIRFGDRLKLSQRHSQRLFRFNITKFDFAAPF